MEHTNLLDGVHIATMAQNVPGPLAVSRLAQMGARVTKIEPPTGDPFLELSPAWYAEMHAGVTVARLDLKTTAGRTRMATILNAADIFITSQRPSALARLEVDADTLRARIPRLHVLRILGSVADPERPGHDLTYQATSGLLSGSGMPRTLVADVIASERVCAGVLTLLRCAPGATLDVGIVESLEPLLAPIRHRLSAPGGMLGGGLARYGLYAAKTGRVAVAALEPHFETQLYEQLGLAPGSNPSERFLARTDAEWEDWARRHGHPIVAVLDVASAEHQYPASPARGEERR